VTPQQIASNLRFEHPDDPLMLVSNEAIYQAVFVPPKHHHALQEQPSTPVDYGLVTDRPDVRGVRSASDQGASESERRESNPRSQLGKLMFCL
jgi:hypothetical protein